MRRKSGNCWMEYREPIDLMNYPSNIGIGLCYCKKKPIISGLTILWII